MPSSSIASSLGFNVTNEGNITSVIWDSPAFNAGLTVSNQVLAVNGRQYSGDALKSAVTAAKGTTQPITLLVKDGEVYRTVNLDWHQGLRYPRLVKTGKGPGTLDALLAPRR